MFLIADVSISFNQFSINDSGDFSTCCPIIIAKCIKIFSAIAICQWNSSSSAVNISEKFMGRSLFLWSYFKDKANLL